MNARNQLEEGCNRLASTLLTDNLPLLAGATNGIKKLRELILELAVRGKLVPQDPSDEPASELLKSQWEVVNVDSGTDYRRRTLELANLYLTPLNADTDREMNEVFDKLAESADEDPKLHIEHRVLQARRKAGGVVWFDFHTLCGGPRSQNDYLELANQFHTIMLSDVPHMPVRLASEARRFTWLVDVLYDRRVKLVISAAVPPEELYTEGPMSHEFPRTVSRLNEMQSKEYLSEERRLVDTSLT